MEDPLGIDFEETVEKGDASTDIVEFLKIIAFLLLYMLIGLVIIAFCFAIQMLCKRSKRRERKVQAALQMDVWE